MSDEHAAYIRGKQLHTFRTLLPFGLTASLFNSIVVVAYLWFHAPSVKLVFWAGLMGIMGLIGLRASWVSARYLSPARPRSSRALYRPITESALLGLCWAACPVLFLPNASGFDAAMILCVSAGMMTGAAYMLSTLPGAAIPFVSSLSFGIALGLLQSGHSDGQIAILGLLACFTVVMVRSVFWNYSNHVRTWLNQVQLKEQAEELEKKQGVISLLLNEFEQAASDCLWELDENHRVVRPSEVLAERTGFTLEELTSQPLINFFDHKNADGKDAYEQLRSALRVNGEINNLRLPVLHKGRTSWWRISAKPTFNEDGTFEGYRGVASDVTEKFEAEKQIYRLAHFDDLTSLPKREALIEALRDMTAERASKGHGLALHVLDIDRFKTINDVFGHSVGNAYLKATAKRLKDIVGPEDFVVRFGGDEFAILQRGVTRCEDAIALARNVQDLLSQPVSIEGARAQSGISLGISLYPDHSTSASELLKFADLALLASKKDWRDAISVFHPEMNTCASEAISLENDLREALRNHQFELHFQPIIQGSTGEICACETLVRWTHPLRGAVSPDLFVPVLEQAGLIPEVGDWIIREALKNASYWDESIRISINLSPLQVRNTSIVSTVTHALAQSGVSPDRVDFEITETALFDGTEETLDVLQALHTLGVTISLDDFGTGYSSLSLLQMFPFDKIKIDKSFVQKMETNPECGAIVSSVISLARDLGMRSTAEGVESDSLAAMLLANGCVELQGYLFSRPKRAAELIEAGMLPVRAANSESIDHLGARAERRKKAIQLAG